MITMNILERIVLHKREEVKLAKAALSILELEKLPYFNRPVYSFEDFLLDDQRTGIIAEYKRRSPSKGVINELSGVVEVTQAYAAAGASALSVLTDHHFFGGTNQDLLDARAANEIPILRKDFIIDEYQIIEAKGLGADIILLIASILTPNEVENFSELAKSLGLNVLLEVHNLDELQESISPDIDAIGVNNRNLADFSVNTKISFDLVDQIPDEVMKISESAISDPITINELRAAGFDGFLIGENFMKTPNPGLAMSDFVRKMISV
jgi:indole-3-glycerol phosphate synthase